MKGYFLFAYPTGAKIDEVGNVEVFVVNKCRMHTGAGGVVYAKVIHLAIAAKQIATLLIHH